MTQPDNPFRITKSNNLTDEQIDQLWVSATDNGAVGGLARPTSPMAMIILGGKGSGKSHLMRYHSFPVQLIRYRKGGTKLIEGLRKDGYVGIYARCGGLDSHRFEGKGQSEEKWSSLFAYYFELWVADKTLAAIEDLIAAGDIAAELDSLLAGQIGRLLDVAVATFQSVAQARQYFAELRKKLDYVVNNAALTNQLELKILVSRGRLFFGIPSIACSNVSQLKDAIFVYLLDEFENFTVPRQIYINTLIREKDGPTSFKIGARLYGIRTCLTLSGGERNLQGSEYEVLPLDERFRNNTDAYRKFSLKLVARRLGSMNTAIPDIEPDFSYLSDFFEEPDFSWNSTLLAKLFETGGGVSTRPHLLNLQRKLARGIREDIAPGMKNDSDIQAVLEAVSFPEYPLLEKLCILHIFQKWFRSANILDAARYVNQRVNDFVSGTRGEKFEEFIDKHKSDMVAQLLRENSQKQQYTGLTSFIRMSEGLPRSLITILKHVHDWSIYMGEGPFRRGKISIRAQQRGVSEAADLFLEQMLMEGEDGVLVRSAIDKLSDLFRVNRFSDKPIETSLIAFSVDEMQMSAEARRILKLAVDTSLLIRVQGGQRQRNTKEINSKLEVNAMLAPRWDLPIARRGVAVFEPAEGNAVFMYNSRSEFEALLKAWEAKMTAPAFGRPRTAVATRGVQPDLFE
jgi:hypothetical protein